MEMVWLYPLRPSCLLFLLVGGRSFFFGEHVTPRYRCRPVYSVPGAAGTPVAAAAEGIDQLSLLSFEELAWERWANTRGEFDPLAPPVPSATIQQLLHIAQAAPSGFNAQPYKMVVVQGKSAKQRLANAMLGSNGRKVLNASFTVVFAADLESSRLLPRILELAESTPMHGRMPSPRFLFLTRIYLRLFAGGHRIALLRPLIFLAKKVGFGIGSHALGLATPTVCSAEAWAVKNTMLAAQTLLLAATAAGLSSCPMEGFDGRRVRRALHIPRRYAIPLVVAVGYPTSIARTNPIATRRFDLVEVAYREKFGEAWKWK